MHLPSDYPPPPTHGAAAVGQPSLKGATAKAESLTHFAAEVVMRLDRLNVDICGRAANLDSFEKSKSDARPGSTLAHLDSQLRLVEQRLSILMEMLNVTEGAINGSDL